MRPPDQQTVAIAIKTVDRSPHRNYLGLTMANLARSGVFESKHLDSCLLVDSGSADAYWTACGLFEVLTEAQLARLCIDRPRASIRDQGRPENGRRTLHQNAARAIELVGASDADWGLVLEDDIDVCAAFLESLLAWLNEHQALGLLFVLGANYVQVTQSAHFGRTFWPYALHSFYGAQALVWRREDAVECARWLGPDPSYHGKRERGHDLLLQQWGRHRGQRFFVASAPSFVQHIGSETTLSTSFFRFKSWPGRDWRYRRTDVLRIPPITDPSYARGVEGCVD